MAGRAGRRVSGWPAADQVGAHFDRLADRHDEFLRTQAPAAVDSWLERRLRRLARQFRGRRVLDLGSGSGAAAEVLAETASEIVLVDASARMLQLARRRLCEGDRSCALRTVRGDAVAVLDGGDDRFAVVLAVGELAAYVPDPAQLLSRCARVVEGDGRLLLSAMDSDVLRRRIPSAAVLADGRDELVFLERDGLHARAISRRRLEALLAAAGLDVVDITPPGHGARIGVLATRRRDA